MVRVTGTIPSTVAVMGNHAIVIGASLAGLCAARVLSDTYDRVTGTRFPPAW